MKQTFVYLVAAADARSPITYGEIASRLTHDLNIKGNVSPRHIGHVVGTLMERILEMFSAAPLLNVLAVDQTGRKPGTGANLFLCNRFHLTREQIDEPDRRIDVVAQATEEVYKFQQWRRLYDQLFQASSEGRNPGWVRDELILALDMYLRYAGNPPGKGSSEILGLSETLNRLARYLGLTRGERFRNANGVYMKLMNFRRLDPAFTGSGRVGLSRGGKAEEEVWADFAGDPARCHEVAETICNTLAATADRETVEDFAGSDIEEAEEGRVITGLHRIYERSIAIVKSKKSRVLALTGKLVCEACEFDFQQRYGERGTGYIECHHTKPPSELRDGEKTKIGDLKLLCSNCHRMVHARRPWLTIEELRTILRAAGRR